MGSKQYSAFGRTDLSGFVRTTTAFQFHSWLFPGCSRFLLHPEKRYFDFDPDPERRPPARRNIARGRSEKNQPAIA
jgi:hypothetical protein